MNLWSEGAEHSLLGSVLLNPKKIDEAEGLYPGDFYVSKHCDIWKTLVSMVSKGEAIDIFSVAEKGFDLSYLSEMAQHATGNVRSNAGIIRKKATERALMAAANSIIEAANSTEDIKSKVEKAHAAVLSIGEKAVGKQPRSVTEILGDVLDDIGEKLSGNKRVEASGFDDLDAMVKIMIPGALIVVAARPSMGKTAFSMSIADAYAKSGKSVLFFSQEMGDVSLAQRLLAANARVPLEQILNAKMFDDEMDRVQMAISQLKDRTLYIDEQTSLTVADIRTKCRQVRRKSGLDLVVIDYLQLMKGSSEVRHEEIAEISRGLKKMAMDLKIPVIALSQLNRGLEGRTDKKPQMSDLRESGQIEQDADVILMPYRDEIYNENSPMKGIAEIFCRKNRQGKIGSFFMSFKGDFCLFETFRGVVPRAEVVEMKGKRKWN